jgi:hypothetical protein
MSSIDGTYRRLVTKNHYDTQVLEIAIRRNGIQEIWFLVMKYVNSATREYDFFIFDDTTDDLIKVVTNEPTCDWAIPFNRYAQIHFTS